MSSNKLKDQEHEDLLPEVEVVEPQVEEQLEPTETPDIQPEAEALADAIDATEATADAGTPTEEEPKNKNKFWRRVAVVIGLIILLLLLLKMCGRSDAPVTEEPSGPVIGGGNASDGGLNMQGYDEIKAGLQSQVDSSYMNFKINLHPVFSSPTGEGDLMIENNESNPYPMVVNIFLTDENGNGTDVIYASPVLVPNQSIQSAALSTELEPGTYSALAMFIVLEEDQATVKNQTGMRIQVTVK